MFNHFDTIKQLAEAQNTQGLTDLLASGVSIDEFQTGTNYLSAGAACAQEGNRAAAEFLHQHGANINTIAYGAALGGHIQYAEELRQKGANINDIAFSAALGGHIQHAEELRAQGANINAIAEGAALGGHTQYAEELRAQGADISFIAHSAAQSGHIQYAEELRLQGAHINAIAQGAAQGKHPLYLASLINHFEDSNYNYLAKDLTSSYFNSLYKTPNSLTQFLILLENGQQRTKLANTFSKCVSYNTTHCLNTANRICKIKNYFNFNTQQAFVFSQQPNLLRFLAWTFRKRPSSSNITLSRDVLALITTHLINLPLHLTSDLLLKLQLHRQKMPIMDKLLHFKQPWYQFSSTYTRK